MYIGHIFTEYEVKVIEKATIFVRFICSGRLTLSLCATKRLIPSYV